MVMTATQISNRVAKAHDVDGSYPDLCHFLDLVQNARGNAGATSAEKQAVALGTALLKNVPGLDASALSGALTFAYIVAEQPTTAASIFSGS